MNITELINQPNTTIVDVREPYEFILGHVRGAINIPLRNVLSKKDEFQKMGSPIVVYCKSGSRSQQAELLLKASGIHEVYNGGGIGDMKKRIQLAA